MAPVHSTRRIPPEITRRIFSYLSSPLRPLEASKFPWYLGHICADFRAIFLSMHPYFWNEIEIERRKEKDTRPAIMPYDPNEPKPELPRCLRPDPEHTMAILIFFLDIIRGRPFSFTLYKENHYYSDQETSYVQVVLSKLIEHSMQWKNVSMQLQLRECLLLHTVKGRVPLLQSLDLILPYRHNMVGSDHEITLLPQMGGVFEDAPRLTRVGLLKLSDAAWKFNWASLTSIHLHSADHPAKVVIATLEQTINLEELTIEGTFFDVDLGVERPKFRLPRLQRLSIDGLLLLVILETPALEELEVEFEQIEHTDSDNARMTIEFLLRSACQLSTFHSENMESPAALKEVLSHMPDLRELSLAKTKFPTQVVKWLAGLKSNGDLVKPQDLPLRHLNSLSISIYFDIKDNHLKVVQNMIVRRSSAIDTGVEGLQELDIETNLMWIGSCRVLKSLKFLCEDEEIDFEFSSWEPQPPQTFIFFPISA